jgi:hypothetical protein
MLPLSIGLDILTTCGTTKAFTVATGQIVVAVKQFVFTREAYL